MLSKWEKHFPQQQILVEFFDDISSAPKELLCRVFKHVGVTEEFEWSDWKLNEIVNAGNRLEVPDRLQQELIAIYEPAIRKLQSKFGGPTVGWLETGSDATKK